MRPSSQGERRTEAGLRLRLQGSALCQCIILSLPGYHEGGGLLLMGLQKDRLSEALGESYSLRKTPTPTAGKDVCPGVSSALQILLKASSPTTCREQYQHPNCGVAYSLSKLLDKIKENFYEHELFLLFTQGLSTMRGSRI